MIERELFSRPTSWWPNINFLVPIRIRWWPPDKRHFPQLEIKYQHTIYKNSRRFNPIYRSKPLAKHKRSHSYPKNTRQRSKQYPHYIFKTMNGPPERTIKLPRRGLVLPRRGNQSGKKEQVKPKQTVKFKVDETQVEVPSTAAEEENFIDARDSLPEDEEEDMDSKDDSYASAKSIDDLIQIFVKGSSKKPSKSNQRDADNDSDNETDKDSMDELLRPLSDDLDEQQSKERHERDQGRDKRMRTGLDTSASRPSDYVDPLSPPRSQIKRSASKVTYSPRRSKGSKGDEGDEGDEEDNSDYSDITPRQLNEQKLSGGDNDEPSTTEAVGDESDIFKKVNQRMLESYATGKLDGMTDSSKESATDEFSLSSKAKSSVLAPEEHNKSVPKENNDTESKASSKDSSGILEMNSAFAKSAAGKYGRKTPPENLVKSVPPQGKGEGIQLFTPPRLSRTPTLTASQPMEKVKAKAKKSVKKSKLKSAPKAKGNKSDRGDEMVNERMFDNEGSNKRESSASGESSAQSMTSSISSKSLEGPSIAGNSVQEQDFTHYDTPTMLEHMPSKRKGEKLVYIQISFPPASKIRNLKTSVLKRTQLVLDHCRQYDPNAAFHYTSQQLWGTKKIVLNLKNCGITFEMLDITIAVIHNLYMVSSKFVPKGNSQRKSLNATFLLGTFFRDPEELVQRVNNNLDEKPVSVYMKKMERLHSESRIAITGLHPSINARSIELAAPSFLNKARAQLVSKGVLPQDTDLESPPQYVIGKRGYSARLLVGDSNDWQTKVAHSKISKLPPEVNKVFHIEYGKDTAEIESKVWKYAMDSGYIKPVLGPAATIIDANNFSPKMNDMQGRSVLTRKLGYQAIITLSYSVVTIPGITDPYKRAQVKMKPFEVSSRPLPGTHMEYLPVQYSLKDLKKVKDDTNWSHAEFYGVFSGLAVLQPHGGGERVTIDPNRVRYHRPKKVTSIAQIITGLKLTDVEGHSLGVNFATAILPSAYENGKCDITMSKRMEASTLFQKIIPNPAAWVTYYCEENLNFSTDTTERLTSGCNMGDLVTVRECTYDRETMTIDTPYIGADGVYESTMNDMGFQFEDLEGDMAQANANAEKDAQDLEAAEKLRAAMRLRVGGTGESVAGAGDVSLVSGASTNASGSVRSVTTQDVVVNAKAAKLEAAEARFKLADVKATSAKKLSQAQSRIAELEAKLGLAHIMDVDDAAGSTRPDSKGSKSSSQLSGEKTEEGGNAMDGPSPKKSDEPFMSQERFDQLICDAKTAATFFRSTDVVSISSSLDNDLVTVEKKLKPYNEVVEVEEGALDEEDATQFIRDVSQVCIVGWGITPSEYAKQLPSLSGNDKTTGPLVLSRINIEIGKSTLIHTPHLRNLMDVLYARLGLTPNDTSWSVETKQSEEYSGTTDEALSWLRTATSGFSSDHG